MESIVMLNIDHMRTKINQATSTNKSSSIIQSTIKIYAWTKLNEDKIEDIQTQSIRNTNNSVLIINTYVNTNLNKSHNLKVDLEINLIDINVQNPSCNQQ